MPAPASPVVSSTARLPVPSWAWVRGKRSRPPSHRPTPATIRRTTATVAHQCQQGDTEHHLEQSRRHHLRHPLGSTQLDASANVAGSFSYNPAAGTVLNAGSGQTLSVTFTPTDTSDYQSTTATATINVNKATPSTTWNNPADITYGNALSSNQLDASANVAGSFHYSPAAGTVLNAGSGQTLSTTFTPTDTSDYQAPPPRWPSMSTRRHRTSPGTTPPTSPTAPRWAARSSMPRQCRRQLQLQSGGRDGSERGVGANTLR